MYPFANSAGATNAIFEIDFTRIAHYLPLVYSAVFFVGLIVFGALDAWRRKTREKNNSPLEAPRRTDACSNSECADNAASMHASHRAHLRLARAVKAYAQAVDAHVGAQQNGKSGSIGVGDARLLFGPLAEALGASAEACASVRRVRIVA
jgi:hypothetical protein